MFRKTNNITLFLVLVVLVAAVWFVKDRKDVASEKTFDKENLVNIDTAQVSEVYVYSKSEQHEEIKLSGSGNDWTVQKGQDQAPADASSVKNLLGQLSAIVPTRLAAKSKSKWKDYEVTDSLASRVKIVESGETTLDIMLGKFSYNQASRSGISYIRLKGENDVYATDGFLSMAAQGYNSWRDKSLIKGGEQDWSRISFTYPADSGFVMNKEGDHWFSNGMPLDSTEVARYISGIKSTTSSTFRDDFEQGARLPDYSMKIEGDNLFQTVNINAFRVDSADFALHSSLNSQAYFTSDDKGVFKRLFIPRSKVEAKVAVIE